MVGEADDGRGVGVGLGVRDQLVVLGVRVEAVVVAVPGREKVVREVVVRRVVGVPTVAAEDARAVTQLAELLVRHPTL